MVSDRSSVDYCFPESVQEAFWLKKKYGDRARFIAGGTDLLLLMEQQHYRPKMLIDLTRISALQLLEKRNEQITIGAAVTYSQLLSFDPLLTGMPFLAKAIRTIGGVQVRNVAHNGVDALLVRPALLDGVGGGDGLRFVAHCDADAPLTPINAQYSHVCSLGCHLHPHDAGDRISQARRWNKCDLTVTCMIHAHGFFRAQRGTSGAPGGNTRVLPLDLYGNTTKLRFSLLLTPRGRT